ncbi:MAG TPA: hypothetical protein VH325_11475 [Bryobacteraceae bacterium]|jgi:hypothetical protein|nr:hypothetical protein [Bryobacteraceae bacterium]
MSKRSAGQAGFSRREWSRRVAVGLTAAPVAAQVVQKVPPAGVPAPAPASDTPEQRLQKAYADIRSVSEQLSKLEVPMDVEPAFSFRAL